MTPGMITRHFDHPSGATATLEMPAGWSRNCWYVLRTKLPGVGSVKEVGDEDRRDFPTPEEARQAAVARERLALSNGWKPRMAAAARTSGREWRFHRPTGEQIPLKVREIEHVAEVQRDWYPGAGVDYTRQIAREKRIRVSCHERCDLEPGERFLLRQVDERAETICAFIVQSKNTSFAPYEPTTIDVQATMTALEPGEQEAIELWHDREAILQAGIETDTSVTELWNWLGTRVSDSSERAQVNAAILRGRAERQARLQREQVLREMRARDIQQQEAARRATELQVRRPMLLPKQPSQQSQTEETLRRLSGGTDLSKPKKRKIDLGE